MRYELYLETTRQAALETHGQLEDLAGGYVGVKIPADGFNVMLVLDMDDESGWLAWRELADGSRCCDDCYIPLGWLRLADLADRAFAAFLEHRCT